MREECRWKLLFDSLDTAVAIACLHVYVIQVALMPLPAEQPPQTWTSLPHWEANLEYWFTSFIGNSLSW